METFEMNYEALRMIEHTSVIKLMTMINDDKNPAAVIRYGILARNSFKGQSEKLFIQDMIDDYVQSHGYSFEILSNLETRAVIL